MKISQFIVVRKTGAYRYSSRLTKGSPSLDSNEVAVKLNLELPDEIFTKPSFEARVTVPKEAVSQPVIEAEVIDNVQDIIKQNTGFEVKLQIVSDEK